VHYEPRFNALMRFLGFWGLGRTQVQLALGIGLGWGMWVWPGHGWQGRLVFAGRLLLGCLAQLGLWLQGKAGWTPLWDGVPPGVRVWLLSLPTLAVSGVLQVILKMMVGRPRPKEILWNGADPYVLHPVWAQGYKAVFLSFPSGHSCSTWAMAVLLAEGFPRWRSWIYAFAVVASASRFLALTPHYLGDVVAGGALGAAVGLAVAQGMGLRTRA